MFGIKQLAARLQDTPQLAQGFSLTADRAKRKCADHRVKAGVLKRNALAKSLPDIGLPALLGSLSAGEVQTFTRRIKAGVAGDPGGIIELLVDPAAAADLEHCTAGLGHDLFAQGHDCRAGTGAFDKARNHMLVIPGSKTHHSVSIFDHANGFMPQTDPGL